MFYQAKIIYDVKKPNPNVTGSQGETALHLAARGGNLDFVTFLLEAGADVHIKGIILYVWQSYCVPGEGVLRYNSDGEA